MRPFVTQLLLAVGFLTRMVPARVAETGEMGRSLRVFPLVGLGIGLVLAAPWAFGVAAGHPWVQAWLWLAGALFVTRGLHWDGWVDLWDAWGSGAQEERFWEVLKDSRMGAFGGMGLFMGLTGQLILLHNVFQLQAWGLLIWIPVLGRTAAAILAWMGRDLHRPGLARAFLNAADTHCLLLVLAQAALLGLLLVPAKAFVLAGVLLITGLVILVRLAKKRQGLNGDFLGTAIIWGEFSALLGWFF